MSINTARRGRAIATTSWLALGVAMAWTPVLAQNNVATVPVQGAAAVDEVIVVGARASQQSSIDRKKRASTPTDSIVADDVGSFPDRSITEAISRVAGTALNRNEFGEGEGVTIRGAGMGQTRIELDGMGVQSTYGLALGNSRAADMRELPADLIKSVDIVKGSTADMTEGSLAGAVKVQTRTGLDFRKPYLSFRVGAEQNSVTEKWTPDLNLVASRKFLDGRLGVIFNGSYREVENVGHTQETTGSNSSDGWNTGWDWDNSAEKTFSFNPALVGGATGDAVLANSTETPRTLLAKSAAANTKADCISAFPFLDTGADLATNAVTNYAAGQANPAGGPPLTAAQATALNAANTTLNAQNTTANNGANNRKTQRLNEQYTCLNQWNDMAPNNIRSFQKTQADKRQSFDLRFDYRVSDTLTVFAKVNRSERITDDQNVNRALGNPDVNPTGRFFSTNGDYNTPAQRYVIQDGPIGTPGAVGTGAGYFNWTLANLYPTAPSCPTLSAPNAQCPDTTGVGRYPGDTANPQVGRGATNGTIYINRADQTQQGRAGAAQANQGIPIRGMVTNIDPASVVVDANHNVMSYTMYNNSVDINQIDNYQPSTTDYVQFGGDYSGERMRVEFMAGVTKANSTRVDFRTARSYNYGQATVSLNPGGVWEYELPATYDDTNQANFAQFTPNLSAQGQQVLSATNNIFSPAFTIAQLPNVRSYSITMDPRIAEATEKVAKVDLTYDLSDFSPFFTRVKSGLNFRNNVSQRWANGGATIQEPVGTFGTAGYIPGIYLPGNRLSMTYRACEETTASAQARDNVIGSKETADVGLCNFGFVQRNPTSFNGVETMTQAELIDLLEKTSIPNDQRFFNSYESSSPGWNYIDSSAVMYSLEGGKYANFDCMKVCTATDGNVYAQPFSRSEESTLAAYTMMDFEAENLPFGMTFNGNVGIRGVHTEVEGTGQMAVQNTQVLSRDVNGAFTLDTRTYRQNVTFSKQTMDWLPSYNLNLWVIPDQVVVRYYNGKQIARPNIDDLLPAGTCIIDERDSESSQYYDGTSESNCSGTIGNPALKPLTATNQSVNLEWYPNRDTSVSLVWQKSDIEIGGSRNVTVDAPLFSGTGITDARTGVSLDNQLFRYTTKENSPGFERTGVEFTAKTAFTFLPWYLRYTGADFNYSTLKSSNATDAEVDPVTGDIFPPRAQSEYYANLSVWYDDGRAQVRVSYQARASQFDGISPNGTGASRSYPTAYSVGTTPPYYPGQPRFTDETKYWDAKASYNINDNVQVFLEGTNLTKQAQTNSTGDYRSYENGTPALWRIAYSGMRIRTGVTFKFQ